MRITLSYGALDYVVVTDQALITVQWKSPNDGGGRLAGGLIGGAIGGGLGAAIGIAAAGDGGMLGLGTGSILNLGDGRPVPPLDQIKSIVRCTAFDVPEELQAQPLWPRVADHHPVVFYPRSIMGRVTLRWWGSFRITFPDAPEVSGGINFWHVGKVRRHLAAAGYPLG